MKKFCYFHKISSKNINLFIYLCQKLFNMIYKKNTRIVCNSDNVVIRLSVEYDGRQISAIARNLGMKKSLINTLEYQ